MLFQVSHIVQTSGFYCFSPFLQGRKNGKSEVFYIISELALVLGVVSVVVRLPGTIWLWREPKMLENLQEIMKAKEELSAIHEKLNVMIGGKEGQVAQEVFTKENLRLLWQELGKEKWEERERGMEKGGSCLRQWILLFGIVCIWEQFGRCRDMFVKFHKN